MYIDGPERVLSRAGRTRVYYYNAMPCRRRLHRETHGFIYRPQNIMFLFAADGTLSSRLSSSSSPPPHNKTRTRCARHTPSYDDDDDDNNINNKDIVYSRGRPRYPRGPSVRCRRYCRLFGGSGRKENRANGNRGRTRRRPAQVCSSRGLFRVRRS